MGPPKNVLLLFGYFYEIILQCVPDHGHTTKRSLCCVSEIRHTAKCVFAGRTLLCAPFVVGKRAIAVCPLCTAKEGNPVVRQNTSSMRSTPRGTGQIEATSPNIAYQAAAHGTEHVRSSNSSSKMLGNPHVSLTWTRPSCVAVALHR